MCKYNISDTIAAISTPIGEAGIGIVRLSGKRSLSIADRIFKPASQNGNKVLKPSQFRSHTVRYGWIIDKNKKSLPCRQAGKIKNKKFYVNGKIIDEVLLTVMRAPRTYTREDILEINCHSGIVPLKRILDLVLKCGARLAEPGEFTRRAFINGRIDLIQAESVLDIIRTRSEQYHNACINRLEGTFSRHIKKISEELFEIVAQLEAQIDFPEEDTSWSLGRFFVSIEAVAAEIAHCLKSTQEARVVRDGISVAISGRPNVGKSSLLNALINEDRCLVTPFAGTTRDTIEASVCLDGVVLRFIDTAGLRRTTNPIERQAAIRSEKLINSAQLIVLVFDAANKATKADLSFIDKFKGKKNVLAVLNKIDLPIKFNQMILKKSFKDAIKISALHRTNLDVLKKKIKIKIWQGKLANDDCEFILNVRQEKSLAEAAQLLQNACFSLRGRLSIEIVVEDLKKAFASLSRLCGRVGDIEEELLDTIFSEFCIGK